MLEIIPRTFVQANTNASELFQMTVLEIKYYS